MSALLQASTPEAASGQQSPEISVLSAAVDGIPWPGALHGAQDGLSVLHGSLTSMLPGLWGGHSAPSVDGSIVQPSITIPFPRFETGFKGKGPEVTIPLANTVFDNGRPFTMFASRWQRQPGSPFKLTQGTEKKRQLVIPAFKGAFSGVSAPLLPISRPRKIVSGLGNIIRQVEVDGKPTPASKELEAVIPELLNTRAERLPEWTPGPMGVWALLVPESVARRGELPQLPEGPNGGNALSEWGAALGSSEAIAKLLASGCRLQRIRKLGSSSILPTLTNKFVPVSGGGGWGLKQGLLSLDPQTRYSMPDEEDVERFIRSFKGESSPDDVITPGSYIQFFVEPIQSPQNTSTVSRSELAHPEIVVGTCAAADEWASAVDDGVQIVMDHFGALSAQGMFISSSPDTIEGDRTATEISTKIDAPNCRVEVSGEPAHREVDTST